MQRFKWMLFHEWYMWELRDTLCIMKFTLEIYWNLY